MNHSTSTTIRGTKEKEKVNGMRDQLAHDRFAQMSKWDIKQLIYEKIFCEMPDDDIKLLHSICYDAPLTNKETE